MTGEVRDFLGWRVVDKPVPGPQVAKNVIGSMAERLVVRVLGARIWASGLPPFYVPKDVATEVDGSPYGLNPDAWWAPQSGLIEVKSGIQRFYVTERQWRAYQWARDTRGSQLPVECPRVFYGFVAYQLAKSTKKYGGTFELLDDALANLRYVLVTDARLVEAYLTANGTFQGDFKGPLSPMLGIWDAHWNIRAHQLQPWAERPRDMLNERGMTRWSALDYKATMRAIGLELADAGWRAPGDDVPVSVLTPRRRSRPGSEDIPGSQAHLFASGFECQHCGFWSAVTTCPNCGEFAPF